MCICDRGCYVHELNWATMPEISQPLDARVPGGWELPDMCPGNQIQLLSKNIKSYGLLTADPPLWSQQSFVCLF